ncbi:membrane lipoprotein lipid attachment site-containing protein [Falsibacillus pallidus]|uniref:Lipoprotein n=1 Tax=Falsibacillus pallidus TaxID=493781 RepID=A0A370GG43_9BACI|nr:membrane lipoprotein lipid attachment site-containing protein [Falsibacillus pallidus]RDI42186.1 hypothetical protein DFR59_10525 [Falsibacillus pallidus]
MKKMICAAVFLGLILAGCQKSNEEVAGTSEKNVKTEETSSQKENSQSQDKAEASDDVEGVWLAKGQEDGIPSTWYFHDGQLVVNYNNDFFYEVAENKDAKGYTVMTIKNQNGKKHALLLKGEGKELEGVTAENQAYEKYLADGTVPDGQRIEFSLQENSWGSVDQAINFWEKTYKNTDNEISKNMIWENYRKDLWGLVKDRTSGDTITLHFTNIGGAGGSYAQLVKHGETTEITAFDGNASYPDNPFERYTVRNSDYHVVKTEVLWKK